MTHVVPFGFPETRNSFIVLIFGFLRYMCEYIIRPATGISATNIFPLSESVMYNVFLLGADFSVGPHACLFNNLAVFPDFTFYVIGKFFC